MKEPLPDCLWPSCYWGSVLWSGVVSLAVSFPWPVAAATCCKCSPTLLALPRLLAPRQCTSPPPHMWTANLSLRELRHTASSCQYQHLAIGVHFLFESFQRRPVGFMASSAAATPKYVTLVSAEGHCFIVDYKCAMTSKTIKGLVFVCSS